MDNLQTRYIGIYFLFRDTELIYIGQSNNCTKRIAQHASSGRKFTSSYFLPCEEDQLNLIEELFLLALRPPENSRIIGVGGSSEAFVARMGPPQTRVGFVVEPPSRTVVPAAPAVSAVPMRGAYLTVSDAASILRISQSFLNKARLTGTGPKFHKVGTSVRYKPEDIDDWLCSRISRSDDHGAAA